MTQDSETMNRPVIRRVRHELKFRELTVTEVSHLTPHMIRVTVSRGTPETRRQIFDAVIVRQARPFRRVDGTWVQFEDNACVITNRRGEVQGSDIKGPVSREAAERWPRIAATAKQIV